MALPLTLAGPLPTAAAATVQIPPGPATVVHTGPTPWSTPNALGADLCGTSRECREVYYQWILSLGNLEIGLAENVKTLDFALNNTSGDKVAYGFSGGARVVSKWLADNADTTDISAEDMSVILLGNGGRKYGGINGWWDFYGDSLMTPTDTQFSVLDVARQYDPIADFPDNPFNLLALANALSGFNGVHLKYSDADLNAPGNYVWTEGNTTYVYIPTSQLPLLAGLRALGLDSLADQWEAPLREIIDGAYDRSYLDDAEVIGDDNPATTVQPVASTNAVDQNGAACSGYNTDGCDINADQSYTPVTAPDFDNAAWQNVLPNLFNAFVGIPRAYLDGLNDLSHALEVTGSWWVYTPTNVLGYDPADPPKITAVTNLLFPFKPLSNALGEHVSWWAKANLPMNAGCSGTAPPTCQDAEAILSKMFTAPIWDLISGYVFPELNNPVSDAEGAAGEEIPGEEGGPVPWSGEAVQLNPWDPVYSVMNYLFAPPEQNRPEPITFTEVVQSFVRFGAAVWEDFNPFVPGSFLWKGYPYTLVTPFIKPFVKILCPSCDPEHPEDPTPFDGELPPSSQDTEQEESTTSTLVASTTDLGKETSEATLVDETASENPDVVTSAVADLLKKFEKAPVEETQVTDVTETPSNALDDSETDKGADEDIVKGADEDVDNGTDEDSDETDKGADEDSDVTDKGADEAVDETDKGADENTNEGSKESADTDTKSNTEKRATTGGKNDDSTKSTSRDRSSDSNSDGAKSSAGASSGGSDSSGGGSDD